jgi:molecular chaperone DnaK
MTPQDHEPILGIDLGTTNSLVAIAGTHGPRVLNINNDPLMPSAVRYSTDGSTVQAVGHDATSQSVQFPDRTILSVKRLMGRSLCDIADDIPYLGFPIVQGAHNTARIQIGKTTITPPEVSAVILKEMRCQASEQLGREVRKAVVTVPAYFDDAQRQATRDAGRIAGLEIVRIINEPTAAALAYGVGTRPTSEQTIVVFDLGGGTFDISILAIIPDQNGADCFEVLATAGDSHLGGDDLDQLLMQHMLDEIRTEHFPQLDALDGSHLPATTRQAIRNFAQAVKIQLSQEESAQLQIDLGKGRTYQRTFTREELEALASQWIDRAMRCCDLALRDSNRTTSDIDQVVLVGGSTRMPLVRQHVEQFFNKKPYTALDPDQVVAIGAAVQASILAGHNQEAILLDVLPLSLGVETMGGGFSKMILRNSMVPARASDYFTTSVDGQVNIKINVLQGEREMASDCRSLGTFTLAGIPPMPAGIPKLEVEFLVDVNAILHVSAVEHRSSKRASLQIVPNHGLTRDEVAAIETASLEHARDDMQHHRIADLIVNAKLDIKWTRDTMSRLGQDLTEHLRDSTEHHLTTLEALIEQASQDWRAVDAEQFATTKQALDEASIPMHELSIAKSLRDDQQK